jgi:hypothetical protein
MEIGHSLLAVGYFSLIDPSVLWGYQPSPVVIGHSCRVANMVASGDMEFEYPTVNKEYPAGQGTRESSQEKFVRFAGFVVKNKTTQANNPSLLSRI